MTRARAKLLLVDDRPENLLALEALLEPLGQELVLAASGEEALRHLLARRVRAILLDVQMPGLDGFQTAELIKQRERTRHIPIIFLTAISKDAEHVFRGYDAGAVDYLMKPFDPQILRSKVAVFIDLWQKTVEIRRQDALLKEQEIAALERASEERYRFLGDSIPQQVWTALPDGALDYVNERVLEYFDRSFEELIGWGWSEFVHHDDLPETIERWTDAAADGRPVRGRVPGSAGVGRRLSLASRAAVAMRSDRGEIVRWFGTNTDIEERRVAEERQTFLAEAGWVLGSSLDYEQTLTDVARLAVPRIADWCAVDIFVDGKLERLALDARRPAQGRARAAAPGGDAARVRGRRRDRDPRARAGARPRDRRRGARHVRLRRAPARDRARARASLVRHRPPRRTRRGLRLDQPRHGGVRAHLRRGRPDARPGAGQARGGSDRQRPALRRGRAKGTRRTGARSRRRRGRPRRPRRRDPALEHGCADDHRRGGGGRAREEDRGRRPRLARDRTADPGGEQAGRAGPGRDGAGRVRRPRALDLGLGRRLRRGNGLRLPRPDRGARARGDEGGLRRHRLARAAHAARRDLRLGADDPAHGHRARARRSRTSCSA